jgi:hypothetical protein
VSDASVEAALRSAARLVVVEAPAGCGKTFQGASFARDVGRRRTDRLLVLTHTHAACSVFSERTKGFHSHVEIRTLDSLIAQICGVYHQGMGLPADASEWARTQPDGHDVLAVKAAALLERYPEITKAIVRQFAIVACDEHQDSTGDRHAIAMALLSAGAMLRIFADPMQTIFAPRVLPGSRPPLNWDALTRQADLFEQLDQPHRWAQGCPQLGDWILYARDVLRNGQKIELRGDLPPSVSVVYADNEAQRNLEFRPANQARRPIDLFVREQEALLVLTRYNEAASSLRPAFNRRIPLWEGHNRSSLEKFCAALTAGQGDRRAIAQATVSFIQDVAVGFTAGAFATTLLEDVTENCTRRRRQKPAKIQALAQLIVDQPDHRGAAAVLARIGTLQNDDPDFQTIEIDCFKEFWEATRLAGFATPADGLAEITHRRTYSRPKPPPRAISTIHKAKGLESEGVVIMPCDAKSFPNNHLSRCLLYVAMSRAKNRLQLVIPPSNPSPLFNL